MGDGCEDVEVQRLRPIKKGNDESLCIIVILMDLDKLFDHDVGIIPCPVLQQQMALTDRKWNRHAIHRNIDSVIVIGNGVNRGIAGIDEPV
jgi:hypothetical protein